MSHDASEFEVTHTAPGALVQGVTATITAHLCRHRDSGDTVRACAETWGEYNRKRTIVDVKNPDVLGYVVEVTPHNPDGAGGRYTWMPAPEFDEQYEIIGGEGYIVADTSHHRKPETARFYRSNNDDLVRAVRITWGEYNLRRGSIIVGGGDADGYLVEHESILSPAPQHKWLPAAVFEANHTPYMAKVDDESLQAGVRDHMQLYVGDNVVRARPMTLGVYADLRIVDDPKWVNQMRGIGDAPGFLIEDIYDRNSNMYGFEGRVSWLMTDDFRKAYRPASELPNTDDVADSMGRGMIAPVIVVDDVGFAKTADMTFGQALDAIQAGHRVARMGWDGKGMFIFMVAGSELKVGTLRPGSTYKQLATAMDMADDDVFTIRPHIDMCGDDGAMTVGWAPSQVDMFATDWRIVM